MTATEKGVNRGIWNTEEWDYISGIDASIAMILMVILLTCSVFVQYKIAGKPRCDEEWCRTCFCGLFDACVKLNEHKQKMEEHNAQLGKLTETVKSISDTVSE